MAYVKLDEFGVVVYKTPYEEPGTVEAPNEVVCGYIKSGETFLPPPDQPKTVDQVRQDINSAYTTAINIIAADYPETERNSWAKQESEARAYVANSLAPTPLLTAIATARGITVADLAARVIVKADAYAAYAGEQIGKRQARMDAIAAAVAVNDLAALQAVEW
ncbi:MAG: hypothetical protein Q7S51_04415 [Gallionellaceae bacterium]|nr:hypothetical protein [Gallionellaceae bacterium]